MKHSELFLPRNPRHDLPSLQFTELVDETSESSAKGISSFFFFFFSLGRDHRRSARGRICRLGCSSIAVRDNFRGWNLPADGRGPPVVTLEISGNRNWRRGFARGRGVACKWDARRNHVDEIKRGIKLRLAPIPLYAAPAKLDLWIPPSIWFTIDSIRALLARTEPCPRNGRCLSIRQLLTRFIAPNVSRVSIIISLLSDIFQIPTISFRTDSTLHVLTTVEASTCDIQDGAATPAWRIGNFWIIRPLRKDRTSRPINLKY